LVVTAVARFDLTPPPAGDSIFGRFGRVSSPGVDMLRFVGTVIVLCLLAAATAVSAGGKGSFVDYYYSSKTLIADLNALAAEINRAGLEKGVSADKADSFVKRLLKAKEGFNSLITGSDETAEINESYMTYIDETLICVGLAVDYDENAGPEKRKEILEVFAAANETKNDADSRLSSNKKKYGIE
jgi:hypothetical protein